MKQEYLYIISNPDWVGKYKYGYTTNPHNRICSEQHSFKSQYIMLWKISKTESYNLWKESDKIISIGCRNGWLPQLKPYLIEDGGGTEFISSDGLETLYNIFDNLSTYNIISHRESLNNIEKINSYTPKINTILPRDYQFDILNKIKNFYKTHNEGKLIWACGLGKSIMSLLIAEHMNFHNVLICVPSKFLKGQFEKISLNFNFNIVVSTYHSVHKHNRIWDFAIMDECHHLAGHSFNNVWNIRANKYLYMTSTEKVIKNRINEKCMSCDFGCYIDCKTIKWAIDNNYITDYNLLMISSKSSDWSDRLSMSVYMAVKAIENYNDLTHILIYTNTMESSDKVTKLVKEYSSIEIYCESLHSKSKNNDTKIQEFKNSKIGIISCVYIFGEGFDIPKLNGVVFAEKMESSIRIVQSALRPNRKDSDYPDKKAYIIIPYMDDVEGLTKCRKIIHKMRNVDESIKQKIRILDGANLNDTGLSVLKTYQEEIKILNMLLRSSKEWNYKKEYKDMVKLNIKYNITDVQMYFDLAHEHDLLSDPKTYFTENYKWLGWYNFLSGKVFMPYYEWKNHVKDIKSIDEYNMLAQKNINIPEHPEEVYGFDNLIEELGLVKRRR